MKRRAGRLTADRLQTPARDPVLTFAIFGARTLLERGRQARAARKGRKRNPIARFFRGSDGEQACRALEAIIEKLEQREAFERRLKAHAKRVRRGR